MRSVCYQNEGCLSAGAMSMQLYGLSRLTFLYWMSSFARILLLGVLPYGQEKGEDKSEDGRICSGMFINWPLGKHFQVSLCMDRRETYLYFGIAVGERRTIFLLDITTNCGFLLGFRAGRHYFAAAKQAFRGGLICECNIIRKKAFVPLSTFGFGSCPANMDATIW